MRQRRAVDTAAVPEAWRPVLEARVQPPVAIALGSPRQVAELVAFTPPHRQAVCLEPYTCVSDAAHLQEQGIDAGWLSLPPGGRWTAVVEMAVRSP